MVVCLSTGANVSQYSHPYFCEKPLAKCLALYYSISPLALYFALNVNFDQKNFFSGGGKTNYHELFLTEDFLSSSAASFHFFPFLWIGQFFKVFPIFMFDDSVWIYKVKKSSWCYSFCGSAISSWRGKCIFFLTSVDFIKFSCMFRF